MHVTGLHLLEEVKKKLVVNQHSCGESELSGETLDKLWCNIHCWSSLSGSDHVGMNTYRLESLFDLVHNAPKYNICRKLEVEIRCLKWAARQEMSCCSQHWTVMCTEQYSREFI